MPDTSKRILAFSDKARAASSVRDLMARGADENEVGIVMADSSAARELLETGPGSVTEAASTGALVSGTLGGIAAAALAVPGLGVLAAGPFVAMLGGAATGATAGGLLGALVGLGIPENEAVLRQEEVASGGALVVVERSFLERIEGGDEVGDDADQRFDI